jgi:hypothetical protein
LSKWQGTDGFRISVEDLRKTFVLENKYPRYALLNDRVLQVAKRELKALYDIGQCDVYLNLRKKETADRLKRCVLNYFAKNTLNVRTTTICF